MERDLSNVPWYLGSKHIYVVDLLSTYLKLGLDGTAEDVSIILAFWLRSLRERTSMKYNCRIHIMNILVYNFNFHIHGST
jgi:hypothetical protein